MKFFLLFTTHSHCWNYYKMKPIFIWYHFLLLLNLFFLFFFFFFRCFLYVRSLVFALPYTFVLKIRLYCYMCNFLFAPKLIFRELEDIYTDLLISHLEELWKWLKKISSGKKQKHEIESSRYLCTHKKFIFVFFFFF